MSKDFSQKLRIVFCSLLLLFAIFNNSTAATLTVCSPPCNNKYSSIQDAINTASTGDIIVVNDGTYLENINFLGKEITVKSANGAANTIINGNNEGAVVNFDSGEGANSILEGFTITNAAPIDSEEQTLTQSQLNGSGIYCSSSSPTIRNCVIRDNTAGNGGGIFAQKSSLTLANCIIDNNSATGSGGGIYCVESSSATILNCTISENITNTSGGGIFCDKFSLIAVINSIIWSNMDNEIYVGIDSAVNAIYSNIWGGYPGTGNIDIDPMFTANYRLDSGSPCIDAGISIESLPSNIGATELVIATSF